MSGSRWVLDTNIVQYLLRRDATIVAFWQDEIADVTPSVSQITRLELLSNPDLAEEAEEQIRSFLRRLHVVGIDRRVEEAAVALRRSTHLRLPDAIIAATAEILGYPLATADREIMPKAGSRLNVVDPLAGAGNRTPKGVALDETEET